MTGQAILKAILAGERDPHKLAALRDPRVKASEEQIARYLEGNWQEDLLFVLKQEQEAYEFCQQQMAECDRQLQQYLQQREDRSQGASLPQEMRKGRLVRKNQWQQGLGKRSAAHEQSGQYCLEDGSQHFTAKQYLSGSAVSPIQNQARRPRCNQSHGR